MTRQGVGLVEGTDVVANVDPRGIEYHWLRFQRGPCENAPDRETAGAVSVAPLHFDRTGERTFATLQAGLR